jgi:hypothetical protein
MRVLMVIHIILQIKDFFKKKDSIIIKEEKMMQWLEVILKKA